MHSHHSKSLIAAGNRPLYLSFPSLGIAGQVIGIFLLTVFHFWLAAYLPPAEDELYYWSWAQHLQSSYFDHPPMVAYFIRFSTSIFGDSLLAIRLPALFSSLAVFIGLLLLAPRGNLVWALLFCPLAFLGSVLMTPDLPLALFWMLYAAWFAWINASLDLWNHDPVSRVYHSSPVTWLQWILGGVLLGFGGLSKYTMLLAVPCGLAVLGTRTRFRAWGLGYALHLAVAGLLVSPVFFFNWRHDFAPFSFQWHHSMSGSGFSLFQWAKYFGGQVLLVGALPFVLFPWIVLRHKDLCSDAKAQVYFWFFVLPFTFFLYKAFRGPLEGNWAIVSYLAFFPVADRLLSWSSFKFEMRVFVGLLFALPWAASLLVLVHLASPLSQLAPGRDKIALLRGQYTTAQEIAAELKHLGFSGTLYTANYQWNAYFRYLGVKSDQLIGASRPSQFTLNTSDPCQGTEALSLDVADAHAPALKCFARRELVKPFYVYARGKEVSAIWLIRYVN